MKRFANALKKIPRRAPAGFTFTELVVVMAVVGTLVAIAVPSTSYWLRQRGVHDAATQLELDLQRAKTLARQRHTNCSVTINAPAANQYTISIINEVVDLSKYSGNVVFSNLPDLSTGVITFTPEGICPAFGGIYLIDQATRYRVRATAAGALSTRRFSGGKWI